LNVRTKIPEAEITAFPWHQDSHYYNEPARGKRVGRTEAAHIVTVWVPLVDATVANGCIWVMPGSHRWGLMDAARGEDMNVRTNEEIEQRGTPIALEMAAGDVLYLTNLTFHSSKMNRTEDSRWSIDFRFHVTATALDGPERDAMEEFGKRQRAGGRVPLPVLSTSAIPAWEEWRDATLQLRERNARNAQIAARAKA
jgi:ectoine hydroxylase-related dioxygenase (phytanoyl-CoA dioxygenase family)